MQEPSPLLVVYDGMDYLRQARLLTILDNLIDQGRIRPIAAALVANGGPLRLTEYHCNDATIAFVNNELLSLAQAHLHLLDTAQEPGAYGVMGASMGGLMAMYTGLRLPQIFGHVLSQSGAFFPWSVIHDLTRLGERLPLKVWMDVGRLERLVQCNQSFHDLLLAKGNPVAYRVYSGGHNYSSMTITSLTGKTRWAHPVSTGSSKDSCRTWRRTRRWGSAGPFITIAALSAGRW